MVEFDSLDELDEEILSEVVREGELLVSSQFQSALGADQRAVNWITIIATLATASFGGTAWLFVTEQPAAYGLLLFAYSVLLVVTGYTASFAVRPSKFQLPGNEPSNWLYWEKPPSRHQCLVEQAGNLAIQIETNRKKLEESAKSLRQSIDLFFWSLFFVLVVSLPIVFLGRIA